jgi:putative redox protein
MTATTPDRIGVMTVTGRGVSSTRTDVDVRGMAFTIDEPPERGGDNAGPTPPETLLAALVGCTNRICHKIAAANGVKIQDMSIGLDARFDRNGVNLDEEIDLPIIDITLSIDITTDASDADVAKIKSDLGKFCPVSKILRRAGTEITEIWTVHPI